MKFDWSKKEIHNGNHVGHNGKRRIKNVAKAISRRLLKVKDGDDEGRDPSSISVVYTSSDEVGGGSMGVGVHDGLDELESVVFSTSDSYSSVDGFDRLIGRDVRGVNDNASVRNNELSENHSGNVTETQEIGTVEQLIEIVVKNQKKILELLEIGLNQCDFEKDFKLAHEKKVVGLFKIILDILPLHTGVLNKFIRAYSQYLYSNIQIITNLLLKDCMSHSESCTIYYELLLESLLMDYPDRAQFLTELYRENEGNQLILDILQRVIKSSLQVDELFEFSIMLFEISGLDSDPILHDIALLIFSKTENPMQSLLSITQEIHPYYDYLNSIYSKEYMGEQKVSIVTDEFKLCLQKSVYRKRYVTYNNIQSQLALISSNLSTTKHRNNYIANVYWLMRKSSLSDIQISVFLHSVGISEQSIRSLLWIFTEIDLLHLPFRPSGVKPDQ